MRTNGVAGRRQFANLAPRKKLRIRFAARNDRRIDQTAADVKRCYEVELAEQGAGVAATSTAAVVKRNNNRPRRGLTIASDLFQRRRTVSAFRQDFQMFTKRVRRSVQDLLVGRQIVIAENDHCDRAGPHFDKATSEAPLTCEPQLPLKNISMILVLFPGPAWSKSERFCFCPRLPPGPVPEAVRSHNLRNHATTL